MFLFYSKPRNISRREQLANDSATPFVVKNLQNQIINLWHFESAVSFLTTVQTDVQIKES